MSGALVARMDEILASAVSQGRAFPFTGEAGDQSMLPFLLGCALTALFLATAALGCLPIDLGLLHPDTGTSTDQVRLYLVEIATIGAPETREGIRALRTCTPAEVGELVRDHRLLHHCRLDPSLAARAAGRSRSAA